MENLHQIARVVMPTSAFADYSDLFVRKSEKVCYMNGELVTANEYKFNTWMNMFAAKKHDFYCNLGEIYLSLDIIGSYKVKVIGSVKNPAFGVMDTVLVDEACEGNVSLKIPNAKNFEGLYFTLYENQKSPISFRGAAWATDVPAQRDNKLAIVSCTFKREEFINKNIKLFEDYIKENPVLKDKIKLFIADNGKSLDVSKNNDMVTIYPNMNAGGAGGFTRGLMEVMALDAGYTRVLFMDDDVEIFPESFYRTLMLSNYLKEEFKDSFINGAMLDLYNKTEFFENLALQEGLWVTAYHGTQPLSYENILKINEIPTHLFENPSRKVDTAWWFHCFDISLALEKGLPSPIFFRGDDVEWSWRYFGKHHISMNGICVWHAPFVWRVSKVADYYYLPRNMFYINSLYSADFKNNFEKYFKERYNYLLKTYDYISLDLLLLAMKHILMGANIFRQNPQEQFIEVNKVNKKAEYIDVNSDEILERMKHHVPRVKKWRKLVYKLTKGGVNAPKFVFKRRGEALEWYPPKEDFMLVREVKVYNLFSKKCEIRKFDKNKFAYYKKEFYYLLNQLTNNYDRLNAEYIDAHVEFSTVEFWNKYLELGLCE